ncbi:hypothetical protein [Mesobacillus harenae]|nr:hypothetical protein [Mesobacillus harenae]
MAKGSVGKDRPDDYKRFAGIDKEYDSKSGTIDTAPQSTKERKHRNK